MMKSDINASHPFSKFLKERLDEVLMRESVNVSHAYFYHVNGCWLAFERSAYAVCQHFSFPRSKIIIIRLYADLSVVAMIGLDDEQKAQMPKDVRIPVMAFSRWKRSLDEYF